MNYLSQFLIISGISLTGELLQRWIPLPIPASVYGILLLFGGLCAGVLKLEQVREVGGFLSSILPVLFISPLVGIVEDWGLIQGDILGILGLVVSSTVLTFAIAGRVAQLFLKKKEDT